MSGLFPKARFPRALPPARCGGVFACPVCLQTLAADLIAVKSAERDIHFLFLSCFPSVQPRSLAQIRLSLRVPRVCLTWGISVHAFPGAACGFIGFVPRSARPQGTGCGTELGQALRGAGKPAPHHTVLPAHCSFSLSSFSGCMFSI